MLHKNYGKSHKELYNLATRVLARGEDVTQRDTKIAYESGFVEWEGDCDGTRPVPTSEYIFWMDRFDPIPTS